MHTRALPKYGGNTTLPEIRILGMKMESTLSLHVSGSQANGSTKGSVFCHSHARNALCCFIACLWRCTKSAPALCPAVLLRDLGLVTA